MLNAQSDDGLTRPRVAWATVLAISSVIIAIDQLSKSLALAHLAGESRHIIGPLNLTLAYNRGIAFGVAAGLAPVLVAIAICGVLAVLVLKGQRLGRSSLSGIGLVLGGAVGNVCDRVFRDHGGAVVDFIDVGWWPVFNVADMAVVMGAAMLVLIGSMRPEPHPASRTEASADAPSTESHS